MLLKLAILAAALVLVWYGGKALARRATGNTPVEPSDDAKRIKTEARDMGRCDLCGAYVDAQNPASCGREMCPY